MSRYDDKQFAERLRTFGMTPYKRPRPAPVKAYNRHLAYIGNVWADEERRAARVASQAAQSLATRYYHR